MTSPYNGISKANWKEVTIDLIDNYPLTMDEIVEVVLSCWNSIFETKIGGRAQIGIHIFPRPQIMGEFLHELIPLEFSDRYPGEWRREQLADEKDLVFIPRPIQSAEIKTSSHKSQIFGNRSYAQRSGTGKKDKSGFYITINFEKFESGITHPRIRRVCFGWIDASDWIGQKAQTGQQAKLPTEIYGTKLIQIY